jgi:hypothetical protein
MSYFNCIFGYECGICLENKRNCIQCFHKCSGYTCTGCIAKCIKFDIDSREVIFCCPYCRQESVLVYKNNKFYVINTDRDSIRFYSLIKESDKLRNAIIYIENNEIINRLINNMSINN